MKRSLVDSADFIFPDTVRKVAEPRAAANSILFVTNHLPNYDLIIPIQDQYNSSIKFAVTLITMLAAYFLPTCPTAIPASAQLLAGRA